MNGAVGAGHNLANEIATTLWRNPYFIRALDPFKVEIDFTENHRLTLVHRRLRHEAISISAHSQPGDRLRRWGVSLIDSTRSKKLWPKRASPDSPKNRDRQARCRPPKRFGIASPGCAWIPHRAVCAGFHRAWSRQKQCAPQSRQPS